MGLKFYGTFASTKIEGTSFFNGKVEIFDNNYSGTPIEIELAVPTIIEQAIGIEEEGYGVLACEFSIQVIGSDTLTAKDFYVSNSKDTKIIISDLDTEEYLKVGYLVADEVSEPYEDGVRVIKIKATDGLETLKTSPFEPNGEGKRATGTKTIFEIIQYCLEQTGLALDILTSYPYYLVGEDYDQDYCTFENVKLHSDIFNDLDCFEVLERVCKTLNVTIFQEDNKWYVVHAFPFDNIEKYYQLFDDQGFRLSSGVYETDFPAIFGDNDGQPSEGDKTLVQAVKEVNTTLDIQKSTTNLIPNGFFEDEGTSWENWAEDHEVDSVQYGGDGTKKEPFHLQINGYQPTNAVDDRKIGGMANGKSSPIVILAEGEDPREKLDVSLRFSAKARGKNVQKAYAEVIIYVYLNNEGGAGFTRKVPLVLSEGGGFSLVRFPNLETVFSVIDGRKRHLDVAIPVSLVDSYGNNKSTYTSISEESISLLTILSQIGFFFNRENVFSGKYSVDDIIKVEAYVALTEGHGQKKSPTDGERWVQWAEVKLELVDKSRAVGLTKNKYYSKQANGATRVIEKKAYFGDYYLPQNFTTMLKLDGNRTGIWTINGLAEYDDLLMLLNRELFSLNHKAVELYDGNLLGLIRKDATFEMATYENRLRAIDWTYDYEGNVFSGRLQMLIDSLVDSDDSKRGVYEGTTDGEEEIEYTDLYPPTTVNQADNSADVSSLQSMVSRTNEDGQTFGDGMAIEVTEIEVEPDVFVRETRLSFYDPTSGGLIFQIGQKDGKIAFYNAEGGAFTLFPLDAGIEGETNNILTETSFENNYLESPVTPQNWNKCCTLWHRPPVKVGTNADGDIYEYTYTTVADYGGDTSPDSSYSYKRFRLVPTIYNAWNDAFYEVYDNVTGELSVVVARRSGVTGFAESGVL